MKENGVTYQPKIMRNMEEICKEMGVGEKTVKQWIGQGAPIAVEGEGGRTRYCGEAASLMAWRVTRSPRCTA